MHAHKMPHDHESAIHVVARESGEEAGGLAHETLWHRGACVGGGQSSELPLDDEEVSIERLVWARPLRAEACRLPLRRGDIVRRARTQRTRARSHCAVPSEREHARGWTRGSRGCGEGSAVAEGGARSCAFRAGFRTKYRQASWLRRPWWRCRRRSDRSCWRRMNAGRRAR